MNVTVVGRSLDDLSPMAQVVVLVTDRSQPGLAKVGIPLSGIDETNLMYCQDWLVCP